MLCGGCCTDDRVDFEVVGFNCDVQGSHDVLGVML